MAGDLPGGSRSCLGALVAQGPFHPSMVADVPGFLLQPASCLLALVNIVEVVTSKSAPQAWYSVALETLTGWMWHQQGFLTCVFFAALARWVCLLFALRLTGSYLCS